MSTRVELGRVLGAFGIHGWIRVQPLGPDSETLLQQPSWGIELRGMRREHRVDEAKQHGNTVLAKLAGVDDRDAADALRGGEISVPRAALPEAAPGEYYWADLIGLSVRNEEGIVLGTVAGLIDEPAHAVLRVAPDGETQRGGERLIPFVEPIVRAVDLSGRTITVDWQPDY